MSREFAGPALGLLPRRHRLLDQTLPLRRQPEGLCAGILARHDLHPAVGPQRLDVAAEGRGIELQDLADLAGPRQVASIDLVHWTMMLLYLNTICEPQLLSPQ